MVDYQFCRMTKYVWEGAMTDADKALVKSLEGNSFELLHGELKASEM